MTKKDELKLSIGLVLTILFMASSVVAAHFIGINSVEASGKSYTDTKVDNLRQEMISDLKDIHIQTIKNGKAIIRLETKIER
jgi:hypothetical protein